MSRDTEHTISNLRDEIQEIDDMVEGLENTNYGLRERIAELEAEVGDRDATIAQLDRENFDLTERIEEMK